MCGIAGQARSDGARVERALIERMCAAQQHRGPDSRGVHISGGAGLGIQRLRIIDLATGDQPIFNEDRSLAVVLNGEIYNFRELRAELERRGHRFYTGSDTEVIVHLYEDEGAACVSSLHGMFAFALWDSRRRRLLVARDRVGKKPLFYSERPGALSFASELGALLQDPEIPRDIDHEALDCYLAFDYVPSPMSAFRAVRKLPPGSLLVYEDGQATIERYWQLDYGRKHAGPSAEELEEEIRAAIRKAVRRRMIADVPLGAFLSGGIDSSAVVAAMAEASPRPVTTFSIGFDHESHNELPYARRIAQEFATEHHELVVKPDAVELLPKIVRHYGEPFADSSAIPSFYLAELARRHVTVALNGDGGDESFAGYQRYTSNVLLGRLDRLPLTARAAFAGMAARLPANGDPRSAANRLKRLASGLTRDAADRYIAQISSFSEAERADLYTDEYRAFLGRSQAVEVMLGPWLASSATNPLDRLLDVDVNTYLPGDLLVKMDIATMAHSLEARSPLLDHEFMELAASLEPDMKARGLQRKVGLKSALRGWVPDDILDAPKRGFEVPMAAWLRGELRELAYDVLLDQTAASRGTFEPARVQSLLDSHAAGEVDNSARIWSLLVLELWQRQLISSEPRPTVGSVTS
jgi:asparagine synthase (glutamine-hydrolysing)